MLLNVLTVAIPKVLQTFITNFAALGTTQAADL